MTISDRLAVLRDGRLMQVGTPSEVYSRPANAYVAGFLGTANMYDARVTAVADGVATCRVGELEVMVEAAAPAAAGAELSLVVRPERIVVCAVDDPGAADGGNAFSGQVEHLVFRGAQTQVNVRVGDLMFACDVPTVQGEVPDWLHEGRQVGVRISHQAGRLLPRDA